MCFDTPPTDPPYCDALSGSRYLGFTNVFKRRTFESVCRADAGQGFGDAMARFGQIATLACFELETAPAHTPDFSTIQGEEGRQQALESVAGRITVKRATKAQAEVGIPPAPLTRRDSNSLDEGWYLDEDNNVLRVCLTGLDRLIGDVYDISLLTTDKLDFTN